MADLSSCYFCGAAMDVSLREYPVVPEAFEPRPDDQETVLLCGTCQRKLSRVVEPVVDAARTYREKHTTVGDPGQLVDSSSPITDAEAHARTDQQQRPGTADEPNTTQSDASEDDPQTQIISPTVGTDSTDSQPEPSEPTTPAEPTDSTTDADADSKPFEVDETTSVFDDDEDDDPAEDTDSIFADGTTTIPSPDTTDTDQSTDANGSTLGDGIHFTDRNDRSSTGTETPTTDSETGPQNGPSNPTTASNTTSNTSSSTPTSSNTTSNTSSSTPTSSTSNHSQEDRAAASTSSTASNDVDVDAKTYNKVVRLLKNRDLPIPRDEIETIAGSAYDIPAHECEAIIDATVKRGLVAERNGNLVHPDGV